MTSGPPSLLRWLLGRALPRGPVRDGLLGDLDELYAERIRRSRRSADLWYARQVLSAGVRYPPRRFWAGAASLPKARVVETLATDLAHGFRILRRRPGFTAVVVLTLALGIGANTAVFGVVRSVLLRPLPFPDEERLAVLLLRAPTFNMHDFASSPPEYVAYRDQMRSWEELAAYRVRAATLTEVGGEPERLEVAWVTSNLFTALGSPPLLGRTFAAEDGTEGRDGVAVLSHPFWMSRYGGDARVIGRTVLLDGAPRTVIGVMPAEFRFPGRDVRFWVPIAFTPQDLQNRGNHSYWVVGRLRPGVTLATAETELTNLMTRLAEETSSVAGLPRMHGWHPAHLVPLRERIVGDVSQALWVMMGAVGLVLMIACANVANLLLVRAEERTKEISVRTALGAGRGRLISQLLAESVVLAGVGGVAGIALAYIGTHALTRIAPADLPRIDEIAIDATVLAWTAAMAVGAGLLFGLAPALRAGRTNVQGLLHEEGRSGTASRKRIRLRQLLVVSQTAVAVVLLVVAGLLLNSFQRLLAVDPGFESDNVLTASITVPATTYDDGHEVVGFYQALLAQVASLPGVAAAGAAATAPLGGGLNATDIEVEGWTSPADAPRVTGDVQVVTPGYFAAMQIRLLEGRAFDDRDGPNAPLVAIVSETLAREYWPGRSAIGGRIRLDWDEDQPFAEVVGIAPDVRYGELGSPPERGALYLPHAQSPRTAGPMWSMTLTVRTSIDPTSLVSGIRNEVRALDPSVPIYQVRTMEQAIADATATQRFSLLLQLLFGFVALSLAAIGLYGVLAFTVARRSAEIGIRMALGAHRSDIRRMVVGQGMRIVAIGVVLGAGCALASGQLVESLLFAVSPTDPVTYAGVVGLLLVAALLACWIPARRASSVHPAEALRAE